MVILTVGRDKVRKERRLRASLVMRVVLRAFHNTFWGMLLLCILSTANADARARKKTHVIPPCDSNFEMKIKVSAVDPLAEDEPVGLDLKIQKNAFRGIASHIHNEESGVFNKNKCMEWQNKFWPMMNQMKHENQRPGREKMACRNIASVEFNVNGKKSSEHFCLGDARFDGLTYLFRRFYDGTDYLMGM